MGSGMALSAEEQQFIGLVRTTIATNPFTEARLQLDREMAGRSGPPPLVLEAMLARVRAVVEGLARKGPMRLSACADSDREQVRALLLFFLYHEYYPRFDELIQRQLAAGPEPVVVEFGAECLQRLHEYGFGEDESRRAFAAFFQLRRAYHFIHRGLMGTSASMQRLRAELWNNVFTHDFLSYERRLWNRMGDFSTLLLGETGTGKGTAAAAIGQSGYIPFNTRSGRFAESFAAVFVAANLSQFAESLIESELFGYRKGAFTGAVEDHEGVLGRCRPSGAIFLDEIGEVSVPVQIKLLRVLQERVYSPVGSHEERRFSGRVIAATNRPLDTLRAEGRFRDDFYYRLCSDQVVLPPLRLRLQEQPDELGILVRHILERLCGDPGLELADGVICSLARDVPPDYSWPGNVRELEQAVRRILLKGEYRGEEGTGIASGQASSLATELAAGALDARSLLARYCRLLHERSGNYGEVARRTGLDRRTVRKYVLRR